MREFSLLLSLALPLLCTFAAARHLARGFLATDLAEQAQRRYRMTWIVVLCLAAQIIATQLLMMLGGGTAEVLQRETRLLGEIARLLTVVTGLPVVVSALFLTVFVILSTFAYYALYLIPWLRIDRLAKQGRGLLPARRFSSLRESMVSLLPLAFWIMLIQALPRHLLMQEASLVIVTVLYLLLVFSLAPLLTQASHPVEPLPDDHPAAAMAADLCRKAEVNISGVYRLTPGEPRASNALVSGLWSPLRRIYITDHMLATFSLAELRVILAHEIGHVRMRHIWAYLGLAVAGALYIPHLVKLLAPIAFFEDAPLLRFLIPFGIYWGVVFRFFSRRFEYAADRYAIAMTGDPCAFRAALEKMADANGTVRRWAKWDFFQTHPPIDERVKRLNC